VVAYVVLALVLPVASDQPQAMDEDRADRTRRAAGVVLLAFGAMLLVANLGLLPWFSWQMFWPAVLILIGVLLLWRDGCPTNATQT
jgi:Domain of unknown function (DUF5668)